MLGPVDTYSKPHHLHMTFDATVGGNASMMNDVSWRYLASHENLTVPAALVEVLGLLVVPLVEQLWVQ